MKKMISLLLALLLLPIAAFASPIGRVLEQTDLELSTLIGQPVSAYEALLEAHGIDDSSGVLALDKADTLTGFYLSDAGFSLYGYAVSGRHSLDLDKQMETAGWTTLQDQYEGGLRFYTFEKATEEGTYTFRLLSCDYIITDVSLKLEPIAMILEAQLKEGKELFSEGYAHERGKNGEVDYEKALDCYLRAAELGYPNACTRIGLFYRKGLAVEQNYEEASNWLRKGDEMGDPEGMYFFAEMCFNGEGVERSIETAMYWYEYAARRGSDKAQYLAALYYYEGRFVEQDLQKARELLLLGGDDLMHGAIDLLEKIDTAENQ